MKSLFSIPEKITTFISKLWPIVWLLFLGSEYLFCNQLKYRISDITPYIILCIVIFIISFILYRKKFVIKNINYIGYIFSAFFSVYYSYSIVSALTLKDFFDTKHRLFFFVSNSYGIFIALNALIAILTKYCMINKYKKDTVNLLKKQLIHSFIYAFVLDFIIYIYVPLETFIPNYKDYNFPYWLLLKSVLVAAIFNIILITVFTGFLNEKFYGPVRAFETGFLLAIYCQYMFMNKSVGILDGTSYDLSKHFLEASFNTIFWLCLTILPIFIAIKKKVIMEKTSNYVTYIIGAIHIISYCTLLLTADKQCFRYANIYYDFSEQYVVGREHNVIVLIIDAADNKYMEELLETKDPVLEGFKDFNIYTNTCSVYDFTNHSQLQMVTNFPFDNTCENQERRQIAWNTPWANEYYDRLHNAGYRVNFFNFDNETSEYVLGNIDNAKLLDGGVQVQYINYKMIKGKNSEITKFKLYPIMLKSLVSFDNNSKTTIYPDIVYNTQKGYYENEEFKDNLHLSLGDNNKYIIYNHIRGVHAPDDNTKKYKYCLEIMADYINELKRLGVYDNSTIIITADHGYLEQDENDLIAATPIFMIKHAEESHQQAVINSSPICHSDLMATILYNVNLYYGDKEKKENITSATVADGLNTMDDLVVDENNDAILFGYPVEYYGEEDIRTRQWFDRWSDSNYTRTRKSNVLCGFIYEGATEDLEKKVKNKDMTEYQLPVKYE